MELEDEECLHSKLRTKGKSQTYLLKPEILELKLRTRRQGKCVGAAIEFQGQTNENRVTMEDELPKPYTYISNDIWFQLANYIAPEDVQRYALICSQSANSVNSCRFWLQLYRRYCQHSSSTSRKWILQLPANLQVEHMTGCDKNTLRQRVIQSIFHCYIPFKDRLLQNYTLETLVGRTYLSSWHKQVQCIWIMCYKFRLNFPLNSASFHQKSSNTMECNKNVTNVDDWESLVDEGNNNNANTSSRSQSSSTTTTTVNDLDGISLLVICCDRFIPFPSDIVYNYGTCPFRLAATRELLSTDMRSINLELDFISSTRDQTITIKYIKIQKYKVVPWWHPDFRILNKCE